MFDMHTAVYVDGIDADGPLRIEVANNSQDTSARGAVIRVKNLDVVSTGKPIGLSGPPNSQRSIVPNGQTAVTNTEISDHQAGDGIFADAWKDNPIYTRGTGKTPNTCLDFVDRLLEHMNLNLDPAMSKIFASGNVFYSCAVPAVQVTQRVPNVWSRKLSSMMTTNLPGVDTWT